MYSVTDGYTRKTVNKEIFTFNLDRMSVLGSKPSKLDYSLTYKYLISINLIDRLSNRSIGAMRIVINRRYSIQPK